MLTIGIITGIAVTAVAAAYLFFRTACKDASWMEDQRTRANTVYAEATTTFQSLHLAAQEAYRKTPTDEIEALQEKLIDVFTPILSLHGDITLNVPALKVRNVRGAKLLASLELWIFSLQCQSFIRYAATVDPSGISRTAPTWRTRAIPFLRYVGESIHSRKIRWYRIKRK